MKIVAILFAALLMAGVAVSDEYTYVPGEYTSEDEVQGTVLVTWTVADMKARYFALQDEKAYRQELVQNAIAQRDAAIATGTAEQARIQEINAEMAELRAAYEAWIEAANLSE